MKKKILFIVFISLFQATLFAQPCLPDGIVFNQQSQVDSFPINYPNCNKIEGTVKIDWQYIINLDSLIYLEEIGGSLKIVDCYNLESLMGLSNLNSIDSSLIIQNNPLLTTLEGFESLTTIGEDLLLENNRQVNSLSAFGNLENIGMNLKIWNIDSITSLSGLENLNSISASLEIRDCDLLADLSGLNNIVMIGGSIGVLQCSQIENLNGLENLTHIGYNIALCCNPKLNSLTVLEDVTSNGWTLEISNNDILNSLNGLENLGANSFQSLYIKDNPNLSVCEVETICKYLTQGKNYTIELNSTGCNDRDEILFACTTGESELIGENQQIIISPNPTSDWLYFNSNSTDLKIDVVIYNMTGEKLLSKSGITEKINLSTLKPGIYIIEINSSLGKLKDKLIIK